MNTLLQPSKIFRTLAEMAVELPRPISGGAGKLRRDRVKNLKEPKGSQCILTVVSAIRATRPRLSCLSYLTVPVTLDPRCLQPRSSPGIPVMSRSSMTPDWERSDVEHGTDASPYLMNARRFPAHGNALELIEEPSEFPLAPVSGRPMRTRRPAAHLQDYMKWIT